jgi:hypothetical protein
MLCEWCICIGASLVGPLASLAHGILEVALSTAFEAGIARLSSQRHDDDYDDDDDDEDEDVKCGNCIVDAVVELKKNGIYNHAPKQLSQGPLPLVRIWDVIFV